MARRTKLEKFADLLTFPNVYQNYNPKNPQLVGQHRKPVDVQGNWIENHFGNRNPVKLELACGKGEYTIELARRYPDNNFIGVDIKGNRIWKGAKTAIEEGLRNVAFLRTRIEQIDLFFTHSEVDEIWIVFPDPFVKKSNINRRLTAPIFLERYRRILAPEGCVHLKTDSQSFYEFTHEVLKGPDTAVILMSVDDLYRNDVIPSDMDIQTYYEKMHVAQGKKIRYIKWQFIQNEAIPEP